MTQKQMKTKYVLVTFDLLLFQFSGNAQFLVCRKQQKRQNDCIFISIKLKRIYYIRVLRKNGINSFQLFLYH